jgi:acyl-CoA synthetase (AMP-forming)/AMP-acid ligase II
MQPRSEPIAIEPPAGDASRLPLGLTLDAVLHARAALAPDAPAILYKREPFLGAVLRWGELERRAASYAAALKRRGLGEGSIAALVLEDAPDCMAALFALWRARAAVVPIDTRWGAQTLETVLDHVRPACIIGEDAARLKGDESALAREPFIPLSALRDGAPEAGVPPGGSADDLAIIAFTSGTTSNPKGVMIRHGHLRHAYSIARDHLVAAPPRRFGSVFRMGGLGVLGLNFLFPFECGSAVVVLPELTLGSAHRLWHEVRLFQVDFLYLVPTLVQLVTRLSQPVREERVIRCVTGAAPISRELHRSFQERFGHPLRNIYGITEASFGVFYGADEADGRGAFHLGKAASPIEARLRDPHGGLVEGPGEGLLEVTGPVVTDGYFRNEPATREVYVDGWIRTGDIARRDEQGNHLIVGRVKDVVIRGGFNIHLEEVDQTLLSHPAVLGACTVGLKGASTDESMAAVVQIKEDFTGTPADLAAFCRSRIGTPKTPNIIHFVHSDLPRNSSGKVVRAKVAELLSEARPDGGGPSNGP